VIECLGLELGVRVRSGLVLVVPEARTEHRTPGLKIVRDLKVTRSLIIIIGTYEIVLKFY
jgi:hypothetical protein